jgi:ribonucleoside-diphosphate reductase beta chain
VVTYHLVIEGYLALGGQRHLLAVLRATDRLPGLAGGLVAIARDESRHVGYALVALRRRVAERGALAAVVADRLLLLASPVMGALVEAIAALRTPGAGAPAAGIDEIRRFVLDSLAGRLRLIGLPEATTAGVVAGYRKQLKDALTRSRAVRAR